MIGAVFYFHLKFIKGDNFPVKTPVSANFFIPSNKNIQMQFIFYKICYPSSSKGIVLKIKPCISRRTYLKMRAFILSIGSAKMGYFPNTGCFGENIVASSYGIGVYTLV